jgi:hypothetical protein
MSEQITQQAFDDIFADLKSMPSYLQLAQSEGHQPDQGLCEWYQGSVELVHDKIYDFSATSQKQKEHAYRDLLLDMFAGSSGPESRMVFAGFKPATSTGYSMSRRTRRRVSGQIPVSFTTNDALVSHGVAQDNFKFTAGDIQNDKTGRFESHLGFLYNTAAVERLAAQNRDLLTSLGHSAMQSGESLAEEVLRSPDMVSQSILLGYSPFTSLYFYIRYPEELSGWDCASGERDDPTVRTNLLWQAAEAIMTPEQFKVSRHLARNPDELAQLDVLSDSTMNVDYIKRTKHNTAAQVALKSCGIEAYVRNTQRLIYGVDSDDGLDKYTLSTL